MSPSHSASRLRPSHARSGRSLPLLLPASRLSETYPPGHPRRTKFSRTKISAADLSVLIESFDQEPLPNFEQQQSLAQRLGMTPRSVQIWFQNRRQRLKAAAAQTRKAAAGLPP